MSDKVIAGKPLVCAQCGLPFARLQNGTLIIESKHRGKIHVNVIAITELTKMVTVDNDNHQGTS